MKNCSFFGAVRRSALCMAALTAALYAAEPKKWTLAAEAFSFTQKNALPDSVKATADAMPSVILEQITRNMNRLPRGQEKLDRKLYDLQKERLSLFLQLSAAVKARDSVFLNGYSKRKMAEEIKKQDKKIAELQKKLDDNLQAAAKEEQRFEAEIIADREREKRLTAGDIVTDDAAKENIIIDIFSDLMKKQKEEAPTLENIVIYQNDISALYAAPAEIHSKGYASYEFEKSCVDAGIQGLIAGKLTVYGTHISAAITVYEYPGAREICHAVEVSGIDEISVMARRLAAALVPKIADSMPVELHFSVTPKEAAAKAVMTIDDSVYRTIPEQLKLNSGVHTISFEAEGYASAATSYSFTGNRIFSVAVEMQEKKIGAVRFALKKAFAGDLFANGVLAGTLSEEERFVPVPLHNGNVLGRIISDDGAGADYFIGKPLLEDDALLYVNAKPFDRSKYIEKRRKWMYASYSALIVSLIPTFYTYGNYFSSANAYNERYRIARNDVEKWQTASNVSLGITLGCSAFFVYELVRYLVSANSVLPAEARKLSPHRAAKIKGAENAARQKNKATKQDEPNAEAGDATSADKTKAADKPHGAADDKKKSAPPLPAENASGNPAAAADAPKTADAASATALPPASASGAGKQTAASDGKRTPNAQQTDADRKTERRADADTPKAQR